MANDGEDGNGLRSAFSKSAVRMSVCQTFKFGSKTVAILQKCSAVWTFVKKLLLII